MITQQFSFCQFNPTASNDDELEALGAENVIAQVLETHKASAGACEQAIAALVNIALGSEARTQAVFERAMPLVAQVLETHKANAGACEQVSMTLYNLANTASRKSAIVAAGAAPALAAVWKAHSGKTRSEAHDTLERLGYNDDGSKKYKKPFLYPNFFSAMHRKSDLLLICLKIHFYKVRGRLGSYFRASG